MRHVGTEERRALLADRHRLLPARRTNNVVAIADDLVALHSSDPATVFLSLCVRMNEPSSTAIEAALYDERTLLRYHAMRRTLWVASPRLVAAMNASSTRKIAAKERAKLLGYLDATGAIDDPERELADLTSGVLTLLQTEGPLTTREIGLRRPELARKLTVGAGAHTVDVGAHTRVCNLAAFESRLMRGRPNGSWAASEYSWSLTADWTNLDFEEVDERTGAATVLRAWLAQFGPGTEADLRWWTGWTATAVRRALTDIEAVEVSLDGGSTGWIAPDDLLLDPGFAADPEPWIAVLPGLDPTVMGWKERDWYLDETVASRVFDRNGNAGPTIWRNGLVVGGWVQQSSGELTLELVHELNKHETSMLHTELERLRSAIGDVRFRVRFPSPNQKALLG